MLCPQKKITTTREQRDAFYERLDNDAVSRRSKVEKLMNEKVLKEQQILQSSKLYTRPRSAR